MLKFLSLLFVLIFYSSAFAEASEPIHNSETSRLILTHKAPAQNWREATPMGNGNLGAMVKGGIFHEQIWLNDDTLWSGEPAETPYPGNAHLEALPKVRALLFSGKTKEAHALANKKMLGQYNQCYLPLGNLHLTFSLDKQLKVTEYQRELDLKKAIQHTSFKHNGVSYHREIFVSHPNQMMAVRISASQAGKLNFTASLNSLIQHKSSSIGNTLQMTGKAPIHADPHYLGKKITYDKSDNAKGMRFCARIHCHHQGGTAKAEGAQLIFSNCNEVILYLSSGTSFNSPFNSPSKNGTDELALAKNRLMQAEKLSYPALKQQHIDDYQNLFNRVQIKLGKDEFSNLPLEKRLGKNHIAGKDPQLAELFYQFGRYLLISSSIKGTQPANLQGIWSHTMNPPWSSNWTINCNAQFNYSGLGPAGLGELAEPFLRMIEEAAVDGKQVARNWYNARGWVIHHNLDLWRAAMPVAGSTLWATFPCGGTWCLTEIFDHWRFSGDEKLLRERIWPLLRGQAEFWIDTLVTDPRSGHLIACPDINFENSYTKPNGQTGHLCAGATPSNMMIRQLFKDTLEAAAVLGITDKNLLSDIRKSLARIPNPVINNKGDIAQWSEGPEWREGDSSQLLIMWGAIYSDQINLQKTPLLAKALQRMLERRAW